MLLDLDETWHSVVFEVTEFESLLEIQDFKLVDPKCPSQMHKVSWFE